MNWYKKGQLIMQEQSLGWDRFRQFPGIPWQYVLIMGFGNPTKKEKNQIRKLGYENKMITPESIKRLEEGVKSEGAKSDLIPPF